MTALPSALRDTTPSVLRPFDDVAGSFGNEEGADAEIEAAAVVDAASNENLARQVAVARKCVDSTPDVRRAILPCSKAGSNRRAIHPAWSEHNVNCVADFNPVTIVRKLGNLVVQDGIVTLQQRARIYGNGCSVTSRLGSARPAARWRTPPGR